MYLLFASLQHKTGQMSDLYFVDRKSMLMCQGFSFSFVVSCFILKAFPSRVIFYFILPVIVLF